MDSAAGGVVILDRYEGSRQVIPIIGLGCVMLANTLEDDTISPTWNEGDVGRSDSDRGETGAYGVDLKLSLPPITGVLAVLGGIIVADDALGGRRVLVGVNLARARFGHAGEDNHGLILVCAGPTGDVNGYIEVGVIIGSIPHPDGRVRRVGVGLYAQPFTRAHRREGRRDQRRVERGEDPPGGCELGSARIGIEVVRVARLRVDLDRRGQHPTGHPQGAAIPDDRTEPWPGVWSLIR